MIRYHISADDDGADELKLRTRIEEACPGWMERAAARTQGFRTAGRYDEASNIWTEVKKVYMDIQHNKCAYCERRLAGKEHGTIEHDIEHFRPKNSVAPWPNAKICMERSLSYDFETGEGFAPGYYLLAYSILNYATACKPCNTPLKSNYFPIAGERGEQSDDPRSYSDERPFLVYPVGDLDEDPERILTFECITCIPAGYEEHARRRGIVTIDFFDLNGREELWRGRAEKVVATYLALSTLDSPGGSDGRREIARRSLSVLLSARSEHTNCVRAFERLYQGDPQRAELVARKAQDYLD